MRHSKLLLKLDLLDYPTKRIENLAEAREFNSEDELADFISHELKVDRVADNLPDIIRTEGSEFRNKIAEEMLSK